MYCKIDPQFEAEMEKAISGYKEDKVTYKSISGHSYSFNGWPPNQSPLERFDAHDYLTSLHGVLLALTLINDTSYTQKSISDEGVIHELLHLALRIDIATENSLQSLRNQVQLIQNVALNYIGD